MIQSFSRKTEADGLIQATIKTPMTVEALTAVTEVPAVEIRIMILIIVAEAPAVMTVLAEILQAETPVVMTVLAEILQAETPVVVMTVLAEILQAETPVVVMTVLAITLMKEAVMMAELRQKQLQRPIQVQHK